MHYDQMEHSMYSKAKGAEAEKKKHNQLLSKMQDDLTFLKRENAKRLKVVKWQHITVGTGSLDCLLARCVVQGHQI